jgi:small GTP-binding protein
VKIKIFIKSKMSQYSFGYKIIILGKTSVGKSSILNRFIKGTFSEISITTINDFYLDKEIEVRGTPMKLEIWDTAGQEKFRSLVRNYYNGSKAAILVYDITDRDSFNEVVNYWYNEVKTNMQNISKYFFIEKY